jgi:hypothetical protein
MYILDSETVFAWGEPESHILNLKMDKNQTHTVRADEINKWLTSAGWGRVSINYHFDVFNHPINPWLSHLTIAATHQRGIPRVR